ncbi:hypothetical protein [Cohnella sp. REN36]|uniref:hypothetical protein n=1 Tax=Cohnella sp. REN36 TaxID=2887347 RepID=UPI001D1537D4|nr:hypothetical protein [Cohnella sp. REN36]MCC3376475.1 hypothetical protein [Cohnella sp. REN36]
MSKPLYQKLYYKSGRAAVLNAPEGFDLGVDVETAPEGKFDFVLVFARNAEQVLKWTAKIIPTLNEDAVFWVAYPKQSGSIKTDINRDSLWRLMEGKTEYRIVSNVAVDDTWSALRFRHLDKVKTKA